MNRVTKASWASWVVVLSCFSDIPWTVQAAQDLGDHPPAVAGRCPVTAILLQPGASWQPRVAAAPAGAVFCAKSGVHLAQTVLPKDNQQFFGEPGAIMTGAITLTDFRRSDAYWMATGPRQDNLPRGKCLPAKPACNDPAALFVDGRSLDPVLALDEVRTGTFFHDKATNTFYFAEDPTGKTVEAAAVPYAFMPNHAKGVVIKGLVIEKYASPAQRGAIYADGDARASAWLIENNEVRLNSGAGITAGDGAIVRGNWVHDNGQLGVHPHGDSVLVEDNEIALNNTRSFDPDWDAGGIKAALVKDLVVRHNWIHHNHGPGLWCDIECRHTIFTGNTVEFNENAGIFYEISYDAVIADNIVRWNGQGAPGIKARHWYWGAEIQIAASENVDVYHNTVSTGPHGTAIVLVDQGRPTNDGRSYYRTINNSIHENEIWLDGQDVGVGGVSDVPLGHPNYSIIETGGNRFDTDHYHTSKTVSPCVFAWGHATYDLPAFRARGQEKNGRWLTESAFEMQPTVSTVSPCAPNTARHPGP